MRAFVLRYYPISCGDFLENKLLVSFFNSLLRCAALHRILLPAVYFQVLQKFSVFCAMFGIDSFLIALL